MENLNFKKYMRSFFYKLKHNCLEKFGDYFRNLKKIKILLKKKN